jgi:hypothetical protein
VHLENELESRSRFEILADGTAERACYLGFSISELLMNAG